MTIEPLPDQEVDFDELDGVEEEDPSAIEIKEPFDPSEIRIEGRTLTIGQLVTRIREDEIDLAPPFQRASGLWDKQKQSRLIESLLIRIPLPAFYMDASDEDRWNVVDGLQRLSALRNFMVIQDLALEDLEYLDQFNGSRFQDLPRRLQRRIEESEITLFLIQAGTPPEVTFNVFKRINTGGLILTAQEIRHALNQGPVIKMLNTLAASEPFLLATDHGIRSRRMVDREVVLRFLAFILTSPDNYSSQNLDSFLNASMKTLNKLPATQRRELEKRFLRAMDIAYKTFEGEAFRKVNLETDRRLPINKALFEAWSVGFDRLKDAEAAALVKRRKTLRSRYRELCADSAFLGSISQSTGDIRSVRTRFEAIDSLIEGVVG